MRLLRTITVLLCAAVFTAASASAEMEKAHRFFEIGVDADAGVSNGWFRAKDIFTETVVIDFTKMADNLKKGLPIDMNAGAVTFLALNVGPGKKTHIGFSVGVEGTASGSVPQVVLDLIGKGNSLNVPVSSDVNVRSEVYASATVDIGFFIKKLGITISPSVFVPVLYAHSRDSQFSVLSDTDGAYSVSGQLNLTAYTIAPLNDMSNLSWMQDMINIGGLDFSIAAEYPILPFLDVGLSIRNIPAVSGKLNYKTEIPVSVNIEGNASDMFEGKFPDFGNAVQIPELSGIPSVPVSAYGVRRPLKIGLAAAVRPLFGWKWFTVRAGTDFCFRLNGETGLDMFYFDYDLMLDLMGSIGSHELAALRLATSRENEVFCQSVGIMLNLRVLELNVAVASQSADFLKSFQLAGLGAKVGVRVGF